MEVFAGLIREFLYQKEIYIDRQLIAKSLILVGKLKSNDYQVIIKKYSKLITNQIYYLNK